MQRRALADQRDHRRIGLYERADIRVVLAAIFGVAGAAESSHLRLAQLDLLDPLEELGVLGVRAGPAALDIVDAQRVQLTGDLDLVLGREREALALRPVAK